MKSRFVLIAFLCLLFIPSFANEVSDVDSLLQIFDKSKGAARIEAANQLMQRFEYLSDTLYVFDEETDDSFIKYETYDWAAEFYYDNSIYDKALEFAIMANDQIEDSGIDLLEKASNLSLLSITYTRIGDFSNAIKYAEETLAINRELGDKEELSSSLNNIAGIYMAAAQPDMGKSYIFEAIEIERTLNRPNRLAVRLGMAAEILTILHEAEQAKELAQEALNIEMQLGNPNKICIRQSQLAATYLELKDTISAEKLLLESCEGLRKVGNLNSLSIVLNQLGNIAANRGQLQLAASHFDECADICAQTGNKMVESKARHMAYQNFRRFNNEKALEQLERYMELSKEIYDEETVQALSDFEAKYETAEKQHQIELQEAELKNQRVLSISLICILIAAIIGLALSMRLSALRKRSNKFLVRTNLLKDKLLALGEIKVDKSDIKEETRSEINEVAKEISNLGALPEIRLTNREKQVIALCAKGLMNKEIAEKMNISQRTVDTHKNNIFKKLGINSTVELIIYAKQAGII